MLNKEQAVAAADALILKAEAEKSRRLERRTARLVFLFPVLKGAPAGDREALVRAANSTRLNLWLLCVLALLAVIMGLWALFGGADQGTDPAQARRFVPSMIAGALLLPAQFLCVRAYLRREVPRRYRKQRA